MERERPPGKTADDGAEAGFHTKTRLPRDDHGPAFRPRGRAGIDGDRYATRTGLYSTKHHDDRHLTLIEAETLAALRRDHDIDLPAQLCRRNVVVEGIGLNRLVGRHLRLGPVVVRVGRLNRPCHYLEKLTGLPVYEPLLHRSGVNCQVLRGGPLGLGDEVREVAEAGPQSEGIVTSVS